MAKPAKNKRQGVPGTGGDPAGARRRSGVPKAGTLAALQAAFFESPHQAETLLRHSIPALFEEASYAVVHPEEAERADRTDVSDEDGLSYLSYGPPAAWQAPYSALRVALAPVQDTDHFIYHGGEEILVPTAGRVRYRFFHTVGGEPPRTTMSPDVLPGMAIRINPQLPHHGWLPLGHEPRAQAWMFFLSVNRAPTDISFRHGIRNKVKPERRRITPADFETALHPARFALVAWGLAEAIRLPSRSESSRVPRAW